MPAEPAAYAFDAYGTLFDVNAAIMRYAQAVGPDAEAVAALWRAKQLEYSWTLTLMGRYTDFWTLTERALDFALARFPSVLPNLRQQLLEAYWHLEAFPDVAPALLALRKAGHRLVIFTNGTQAMARAAAQTAGVDSFLDDIVSVEAVRAFKTSPLAYSALARRCARPPGEIALVSSNRWDVAGAANAGFITIWCNRTGQADEYPELQPQAVVKSLAELAGLSSQGSSVQLPSQPCPTDPR